MRIPSPAEASFAEYMRDEGIDTPEEEYVFHPTRNWRFDFAWPEAMLAVEIEGILHRGKGSRHQRLPGFEADAEKYEAAMLMGWRVYRIPSTWVCKKVGRSYRHIWRPEVAVAVKSMLECMR